MTRYIFVCGGVMSGIGKGITSSSIGRILLSKGFKVSAIKIDPYVNVDAGTMNPIEHGEVFVTHDGEECDQDVGNYERFLNKDLSEDNYITTGKVYQTVIQKERNLEYGGRCVEVVPDIPNEVIRRIKKVARKEKPDFILIEIGGTVGEYQNLLFLEAARIIRLKNPKRTLFVLVSYLPVPKIIGEMKTKPTQYAVRTLNSAGIQPDIIVARAEVPIDEPRRRKISVFCNVSPGDIVSAPDVKSIYEVPLNFEKDNIGNKILNKFHLKARKSNLAEWKNFVRTIQKPQGKVTIGIVGKYFKSGKFTLMDSYISVIEAIKHASLYYKREAEVKWFDSEKYEKNPSLLRELKSCQGIIVPGGFGKRGIEGKIKVINYCRKNKIPFLGLCLGMQLAVVEFARNVAGLKGANSTEFDPKTKYPVIDILEEQKENLRKKQMGGTMRLGDYLCRLSKGSLSMKAYGRNNVLERHRHRYEFNNQFRNLLSKNGLIIAGVNPQRDLVEIIEIKNHPFFVATQFHPELRSRPLHPHPLFKAFVYACIKQQ